MCNTCNTGYNCYAYNTTSSCNGCGSCWNNGQRVCRDECGNLRVYSCNTCTCNQCGGNGNGTSTSNNGNGYGCVTICGSAFNATQNVTTETTNGIYYPRYYGYRGRSCGCGCYNN